MIADITVSIDALNVIFSTNFILSISYLAIFLLQMETNYNCISCVTTLDIRTMALRKLIIIIICMSIVQESVIDRTINHI